MLQNLGPKLKQCIAAGYDSLMVLMAFQLSIVLRVGGSDLISTKNNIIYLFLALITQMSIFVMTGFYKGIWRYSSTYDLIRIIKGSALGSVATLLAIFMFNRLFDVPRTVFIIDWLFLIVFLGGGRLGYRIFRDSVSQKNQSANAKKVLIIGAGSGGEQIFREIRKNPSLDLKVIGFLDDDKQLSNRLIHGCPIIGRVKDIDEVVTLYEVDLIYLAIPSANGEQIKKIHDLTKNIKIPLKVLPKIEDILSGDVSLSQFRNIEVGDILGRKEINLDSQSIKSMLENKTILISGAGGSIGSEIVRQVSKFNPKELILVDNSEFNLYQLEKELSGNTKDLNFSIHMVDIKNEVALREVFKLKPDVIFHAAAYKHVPLVEANPHAGVETNIRGTRLIAELANEYEIQKFVLISSDKAVNPTNVMGATKRVAELICLNEQKKSEKTKFLMVRFGNVLGSSGSVIPLFKKQIEEGGPITVTHPEIKRYFMSIPEASQLVLQAGAIGNGGEIFVLDMGEPIFILDIAKQMISLSGRTEDEVKIKFVGLRPGEKMFEELLLNDESTLKTIHPMVLMAMATELPNTFQEKLDRLLGLGPEQSKPKFKRMIQEIVPQYKPDIAEVERLESNSTVEKNLH